MDDEDAVDDDALDQPPDSGDDDELREVLGMAPREAPPVFALGQILDGTYRIDAELGAGGMGRVYRAFDLHLGRDVAIKLHLGGGGAHADERLAREAAALARLSHPNVVTVHALGTWNGHRWVAMEYVAGGDARAWLEASPRSAREIIEVYVAAARGLAAAHAAGIVHRDFKPENVLIGNDGRARVADFGLARDVDAPSDAGCDEESPARVGYAITGAGAVLGTPAYMAPEQRALTSVGPAADQFAFAVALWEALTGSRPFAGDTIAELSDAISNATIRGAGPNMPADVARVLRRALDVDPLRRWPSMTALAEALTFQPKPRRMWFLLGGGVALVATTALWMMPRSTDGEPAPCASTRGLLDPVWPPARRSAVISALEATNGDAKRVVPALDAWASRWQADANQACEATHVGRTQSPVTLDLRMSCYARARDSLETTVGLLASADHATAARAMDLVMVLPSLDDCSDLATLLGRPEQPMGFERGLRSAFDAALARIDPLVAAGQPDKALVEANALLELADAMGDPSARAEARLKLGSAQYATGARDGVVTVFEDAANFAAIARDDTLLARSWLAVIGVLLQLQKTNESERLLSVVDAALKRVNDPPALRVRFLEARGELRNLRGAYADARTDLTQAVEMRTKLEGETPTLARTLNKLASVLAELRELAAARTTFERAAGILEMAYGKDHRNIGVVLTGLGNVEYLTGDFVSARNTYERSLRLKVATMGPDHPALAPTHGNIALVLLELRDLELAEHHAARATTLVEASAGPDHPMLGQALYTLGTVQIERGNHGTARATFERAARLLEAAGEAPPFAQVLLGLARIEINTGAFERARGQLTRVEQLIERGPGPRSFEMASLLIARGKLLRAQGRAALGRESQQQGVDLLRELLGTTHPDYLRAAAELAR